MQWWKRAACGLLALATVGLGAANASARTVETGFLDRTVVVEGDEYRYQVYVPREFKRSTKWPVILALHGGGDYGDDGIRQTASALADMIRRHSERVPAIVVFPQAHADGKPGWQGAGGRAAIAAVDKAINEFSGDPSRVYLTGFSAGGNGSWSLASRYPERFAAVVVMSGWVSEFRGKTSGILYPALAPSSEQDPFAAMARQVAHQPIWIFHGDADQNVSVEESRRMFAALKTVGADVRYTEFPGVAHDAKPAFDRADLLEWLLRQRRRWNR